MIKNIPLLLTVAIAFAACSEQKKEQEMKLMTIDKYPSTTKVDSSLNFHGTAIDDP